MDAKTCIRLFERSINDYHLHDSVDQEINNPFIDGSIEGLIYLKNWIDTVQWHYEDLIRDPEIDPKEGMKLKRLIDSSNQHRTDVVEQIDDWFLNLFKDTVIQPQAGINTESPAWVVDRMSILSLKIFHVSEQVERKDATPAHQQKHQQKLAILLEQQIDLSESFNKLMEDLRSGEKIMKVYRQMKLYNDPESNPVLYKKDKP